MPFKPLIFPSVFSRSPWHSLVLLLGLLLLGASLGQLVGTKLVSMLTEYLALGGKSLHLRKSLLILQATTACGALILAPLLYLRLFTHYSLGMLFQWQKSYTTALLVTLGLSWAFMVVNTWFVQWNMTIQLPHWLRAFEEWAQEKEAALKKLTTLFTTFHSTADLGIGIMVMGIIPAIGEELLFRGLIQQLCYKITNNIHLAIGVSAFAFSAIHLQFYGFIPRFLLGILFGYIYWWTKDLTFPMVAHFFNNAFTLLMLFLFQQGLITQEITTPVVPSKAVLGLFFMLTILFAYFLKCLSGRNSS